MIQAAEIFLFINRNWLKLLVCFAALSFSCSENKPARNERSDPPQGSDISYAKRFRLEEFEGYSLLSIINPWQGANNVIQKWYLVQKGEKHPAEVDSSRIIEVPVQKVICMSTTHLAMISALNETATVIGFSGTKFIYGADFEAKVSRGDLSDIGFDDNLNKELVLKLNPDLIMVYGIGGESAGYIGKLKELGIKVLFNADYLETDPLGKAEWIKMVGSLYTRKDMADSIFRNIENEYNQLKIFIGENAAEKPKVLLGLPFRDTWFISPGNSYISELLDDAGGDYLWKQTTSSVSMPTGIENVFLKALDADYWLNAGSVETMNEIMSIDPRLSELRCFKNGNVFNNNKRINAHGGNDYWESGSLNPDIILKDIATILHPGLFRGYDLFYYRKLD